MTAEKPIIRYKLTDANGFTRRGISGETLWQKGTIQETTGEGDLCGPGWTHVYTHPLLAVMLDPIHGQYGPNAKLISVKVNGKNKTDHGLKEGWTTVRYRRAEKLPKVSMVQRVAFGVICSMANYKDPGFTKWAKNWLLGKDRSAEAAGDAVRAAQAAEAAAEAARAAWAARAAVRAARDAARDAARATGAAAEAAAELLDLITLAKKAMKVR